MREDADKTILSYAMPTRPIPIPWENLMLKAVFIVRVGFALVSIILRPINGRRMSTFGQGGSQMFEMAQALEAFFADCGRYPTSAEGFQALIQAPNGISNWKGPYIDRKSFIDPWGNAYSYSYMANRYFVETRGDNGIAGDQDDQVASQRVVLSRESFTGPDGLLGTPDDPRMR